MAVVITTAVELEESAKRFTVFVQQAVETASLTRSVADRDIHKLSPDVEDLITEKNLTQPVRWRYRVFNDNERLLNYLQHRECNTPRTEYVVWTEKGTNFPLG